MARREKCTNSIENTETVPQPWSERFQNLSMVPRAYFKPVTNWFFRNCILFSYDTYMGTSSGMFVLFDFAVFGIPGVTGNPWRAPFKLG
jgi:hypothetical protein